MKKLTKFLCILCLFCLAACSGSTSYNSATCESLVEKIKDKQEMTETDYNEMIDQFCAIVSWMADEKKKTNGDEAAFKEALSTEDGKKKAEYMIYFGLDLEKNKDKLSASNVKKLAKFMNEMNELTK